MTFTVLCTVQRWCRVVGDTASSAFQKPSAPSPVASSGAMTRPRALRSTSSSRQLWALSRTPTWKPTNSFLPSGVAPISTSKIVARDRAGAYADGVRSGAPEAVQVTDRWHLLCSLGGALARLLDRHHDDLRAAAAAAVEGMQGTRPAPDVFSAPAPQGLRMRSHLASASNFVATRSGA